MANIRVLPYPRQPAPRHARRPPPGYSPVRADTAAGTQGGTGVFTALTDPLGTVNFSETMLVSGMLDAEARLARVDRILRRRQGYEIGFVLAEGIIAAGTGTWVVGAMDFDPALLGMWLLLLVLPLLLLRSGFGTSRRKVLALLRALGPRLADVDVPKRRPLHIVLDNGFVLRPQGVLAIAFLFFGMDGEVIVPSVDEALKWTRAPWRLRRVGVVAPGQGPPGARKELRSLRSRVGLRIVGVGFQERPSTDLARDPSGARWIATTTLSRFRGLEGVPALEGTLDEIVTFLRHLRTTYFRYSVPRT